MTDELTMALLDRLERAESLAKAARCLLNGPTLEANWRELEVCEREFSGG